MSFMKDFIHTIYCGECGSQLDMRFIGQKVIVFWCSECRKSVSVPSDQFPSTIQEVSK